MDYTRKQAAAYLDMSQALFNKILYSERTLHPSYYVGRSPMFTAESLDELREQRIRRDAEGNELCCASGVARRLGITRQAIYGRIQSGSLVPDMIIGGRKWFRVDKIRH